MLKFYYFTCSKNPSQQTGSDKGHKATSKHLSNHKLLQIGASRMGTTEMRDQSKELGIFNSLTEYAANFQSYQYDGFNKYFIQEGKIEKKP